MSLDSAGLRRALAYKNMKSRKHGLTTERISSVTKQAAAPLPLDLVVMGTPPKASAKQSNQDLNQKATTTVKDPIFVVQAENLVMIDD